ncbi:MAG: hypothetical protein COU08_02080 [Candidatus Harrisonbacteria bacterium CG10_big_fil_rev_8_21_14_0_10_42_17]|uniref:Uncharacterized protein n=1 Tax=Candidatus Harrisonbacteria bacterium CG10_big_fil_rev_8_21_14_0_10_42_17 TaxID=1974584 RepID=A0A2M6WI90_9BACT|nr:MAG: hypothetical protein COU08_02080 [Candidatus Harrisonbacteria bacterium CG10_big_fil_rev_8_21_14_0_10_42_17]
MIKKLLKNRRELFLWSLAIVLLIIVISYAIFAAHLIANRLNVAFQAIPPGSQTVETFKLETLKTLLENRTATPPPPEPTVSN